MADLQQARAAKAHLRRALAHTRGLRGIGVTPVGDGYAVQVNLERQPDGDVPRQVNGVPVQVKVVGSLAPR